MSSARRWLLEVEVGRVYRWAVERLEVDGHVYRAGLEELTVADGATSVRVRVTDPAVRWARVAPLVHASRLVLRRWAEGTALDAAEVVVAGAVDSVEWDTDDAPVVLTATIDDPLVRGTTVPGPLARSGALTWPEAGSTLGDEGVSYPVIFGYPGYSGSEPPYACVPVALAQWSASRSSTLAIVAEDPDAPITACYLHNEPAGAGASQTVARRSDLLGRALRVATFATSASGYPATATEARSLFAGYSPAGGGGPRTAYDVLVYLLRRWGADTYEPDRLSELEGHLDGYVVDSWIDQPMASPWEWIERVLVPDLPVVVRVGPTGRRYLAPRVWRASPEAVVGSLVVDRSCSPASTVRVETVPYNEFTAEFREDRLGTYQARVIATGRDEALEVDDVLPLTDAPVSTSSQSVILLRSGRCRDSRALYGHRPAPPLVVDWTWDEGTVLRVLEDRIEREAIPALITRYTVRGAIRWRLREGDVVELTDAPRELEGRLAVVHEAPVAGTDETTITLRIPR